METPFESSSSVSGDEIKTCEPIADINDGWDECFHAAVTIARRAGDIIREAFKADKQVLTKACFADLVTETDKKVEEIIIGFFRHQFPSHSFIGEESAKEGEHYTLTDNPTWIIDPIDGTTNFVHRFPVTAVSIALVVNKKCVVAVVYNPVVDELFTARPQQGAYCNEQKLTVTNVVDLSRALICAEFGSSRDMKQLDYKLTSMRNVIELAHGIRSQGSAALNMCSVACGRVDGYWEFGIHAWDIAAGQLIVEEAGGVVLSTNGGPIDLLARRILCAGTETLARQLQQKIAFEDSQQILERD